MFIRVPPKKIPVLWTGGIMEWWHIGTIRVPSGWKILSLMGSGQDIILKSINKHSVWARRVKEFQQGFIQNGNKVGRDYRGRKTQVVQISKKCWRTEVRICEQDEGKWKKLHYTHWKLWLLLNKMEIWESVLMYLAILCNSTAIEMYEDKFLILHCFYGCQMLR